jgi:hypothetical protein
MNEKDRAEMSGNLQRISAKIDALLRKCGVLPGNSSGATDVAVFAGITRLTPTTGNEAVFIGITRPGKHEIQ